MVMGCRMDVVLADMEKKKKKNILILLYSSIQVLGLPGALGDQGQYCFLKKPFFFPEQHFSTMGLEHSISHVINKYAVIQALLFHL